MEKIPWQGKVARIVGEGEAAVLYLSAGQEVGLKEGDVLEIYHPGETILDPDTKLVLGQTESKTLGKCRITRVLDKNLSTARLMEGGLPEVGDQVRIVKSRFGREAGDISSVTGIVRSIDKNRRRTEPYYIYM